jgi:long-chain acyl-CoA synthetase
MANIETRRPDIEPLPKTIPDLERETLVDILERAVKNWPHRIAAELEEDSITFSNLRKNALHYVEVLRSRGVCPGDRVAIALPNTPDVLIAIFATLYAGGIVVNVTATHSTHALREQLRDCEPRCIIIDLSRMNLLPHLEEEIAIIAAPCGSTIDHDSYTRCKETQPQAIVLRRIADNDALSAPQVKIQALPISKDATSPAVIQYTSGTTASPKGVLLSHKNILATLISSNLADRSETSTSEFRISATAPASHVFGLVHIIFKSVLVGNRIVFLPSFAPPLILDYIDTGKVDILLGVPALYAAIFGHSKAANVNFSRLRVVGFGGCPMSVHLRNLIKDLSGVIPQEAYGLSEASGAVAGYSEGVITAAGSMGNPYHHVRLEIRDPLTNEALDAGSIGEMVPKIYLVSKLGAKALTLFDLRSFLKGRVSSYEMPMAIEVLTSLPRTPSGKVDRVALSSRGSDQ